MESDSHLAAAPGSNAGERRPADWYELFFDLVFVVAIAVSAHVLEHDPSLGTVAGFVLLFFPLWWAWVNLMITNNLYGRCYAAMGVLVVVAMPGPAAMAVAVAGGIADNAWLYVLGAIWIRIVLLVMWMTATAHGAIRVPLWRSLGYNLGTAALWLASLAVPAPYRYWFWTVAVLAEMLLLVLRSGFAYEVYEQVSIPHLLERIGLFVVIVIGEAVYLAVTGLIQHPNPGGAAAGLSGFVVCAFLARAFFRWGVPTAAAGLGDARRSQSYGVMRDVVMYFPFFVVTALTFVAAALGTAVADAQVPLDVAARALLAVGIGGYYLANALIALRLGRRWRRVLLVLALGIMLPGAACLLSVGMPAWSTLALVAVALAAIDGSNAC
ncbi:low temperature requirement protein A [Paeniglutamicibacter gangotriensis]|nr:low temperature requirement protein A [Paeniglutamicibacter gangotriensis]